MRTSEIEKDVQMSGTTRARRVGVALAIAVLGFTLTACGESADESEQEPTATPTSPSTAPSDGYPFDTADDGEELLAPDRRSFEFGPDAPISWQFPSFYADGESDETSTSIEVDGVVHGIQVVAGTGTSPRDRAEELAERLKAGPEAIHEISLGGRDWVAVVNDGPALSRVVLYGSFPDGVVAGAGFTADTPLAQIPPERIAELHQTVLSIQFGDRR